MEQHRRAWAVSAAVALAVIACVQLSRVGGLLGSFGGGGAPLSAEGGGGRVAAADGSGAGEDGGWVSLLMQPGGQAPDPVIINERVAPGTTQWLASGAGEGTGGVGSGVSSGVSMECGDAPCNTASFGGDVGSKIKGALGDVLRQLAGNVVDSYLQPQHVGPLQWRDARNGDGTQSVMDSTRTVTVPMAQPVDGGLSSGKRVPVQLNTRIIFPKPTQTRVYSNPCAASHEGGGGGCSGGQQEDFTEKDMAVRLDAVRRRVDERLADSRRNWEDEVLATKQRFRERIQGLKQRADALGNQV
jgi:hypothetical protein